MATSSSETPRAISILDISDDGKVQLNIEELKQIFRQPKIRNKPICIVSISGAFRKGKSFMMNFFMKYLRDNGNPAWKRSNEALPGFDWRGGRKACTSGIMVWSEVFIMMKGVEEVAILLVDTQGLFDNKTDNKQNTLIFALSTLISSVQIFNLSHQIQENDLGFLQFFTAYAQAARKELQSYIKPFQTLTFLVRDWQHGNETGCGLEGGEKYLNEVLSESKHASSDISSVREHLRSSFEDIKCCLMPYPGEKVAETTEDFIGCWDDIREGFVREIDPFLESLFLPKNLVVKKINGQQITSNTLLKYIIDCSKELVDGNLPTPKTMMESTAEGQNSEAQEQCYQEYLNVMNKYSEDESSIDEAQLDDLHLKTSSDALKKFEARTGFGTKKCREKYQDRLEKNFSREFSRLKKEIQRNKTAAESKILQLITELAEMQQNNMKKEIGKSEKAFLAYELENIHNIHRKKVYDLYQSSKMVNIGLRDQYRPDLKRRVDENFERVKEENKTKRAIVEEKNEEKKLLKTAVYKCTRSYEEKMKTITETYIDEAKLSRKHKTIKNDVLDVFEQKLLDIDPEQVKQYAETCSKKLEKAFKYILENNSANKEQMTKALESQRLDMHSQYELAFSKMWGEDYVHPKDLDKVHRNVIEGIMKEFKDDNSDPIYIRHKETTRKELEEKWEDTKEKNRQNATWFRWSGKGVDYAKKKIMNTIEFTGKIRRLLLF